MPLYQVGKQQGKNIELSHSSEITDELLLEQMVLCHQDNEFSLHVTPDDNYNLGEGSAYFKWIPGRSFGRAREIARIRFDAPEYVNHTDPEGRKRIKLDSRQRKELVAILQSPISNRIKMSVRNTKLRPYINTGWDYLLYAYNMYIGNSNEELIYSLAASSDTAVGIIISGNRNLLPMRLQMPDYRLLPDKNKK